MIKNILKYMAAFAGIMIFSLHVFADSVSLYANIDDSSSQCNILIDAMKNDPGYDPYNEFVVLRAGERDYRIYFGKDVLNGFTIYYKLTPAYGQTPASLVRGSSNGLNITKNGYYYVGNIEGSLASSQAETYKMGFIIMVAAIVIIILILFKIFRKGSGAKVKYYKVR